MWNIRRVKPTSTETSDINESKSAEAPTYTTFAFQLMKQGMFLQSHANLHLKSIYDIDTDEGGWTVPQHRQKNFTNGVRQLQSKSIHYKQSVIKILSDNVL